MKYKRDRQKGVAMVLTLVVMATLLLGGIVNMGMRIIGTRQSGQSITSKRAYYCAEAGLAEGLNFFRANFAQRNVYLDPTYAGYEQTGKASIGDAGGLNYSFHIINNVDALPPNPVLDSDNTVIVIATCTDPILATPISLQRYLTTNAINGAAPPAASAANNLLQNPGFQTVGPSGNATSVTTTTAGGSASAAAGWSVWTNTPGQVQTALVSSTLPQWSQTMIHVVTQGPGNGLYQTFSAVDTGPIRAVGSAWVFVNSGQVGLGTGNGGNTGIDVTSATTGQWEYLHALNGVSPANELILYSTSPMGADFFVAYTSVVSVTDLLLNPGLDSPGPAGQSTTATTTANSQPAGNAAADKWLLWNSVPGTITTELLPTTRLAGSGNMVHVVTQSDQSGLYESFSPPNTGPQMTQTSVWVFVKQGRVGIGTGNGSNTGIDVNSTTTGQWELLQAPNGVAPGNEIIIYATSTGGADFFVDDADVHALN